MPRADPRVATSLRTTERYVGSITAEVARPDGNFVLKTLRNSKPMEHEITFIESLAQSMRNRRVPGAKGIDVICPAKRAPHRPGMVVPQSGHVPVALTRYV